MARFYKGKRRRISENKYEGIGIVPPGARRVIAGEPRFAAMEQSLSPYQKKILRRTREANMHQNL